MTKPRTAVLLRQSVPHTRRRSRDPDRVATVPGTSSHPSDVPDARIDAHIEHVRQEVDANTQYSEHQHGALHDRKVTAVHGLHDQTANPGPTEDRLRHDGAR